MSRFFWGKICLPAWMLLLCAGIAGCDSSSDAYQATFDFDIESAASRPLAKGVIWVSLPGSSSAGVRMADGSELRLLEDNLGNRQMQLELQDVPVGYRSSVSLLVTAPDDSAAADASAPTPGGHFLAAEPLVETEAPAIIDASSSLRGNTPRETVANIHEFVRELPESQSSTESAEGEGAVVSPPAPFDVVEPTANGALKTLESGADSPVDRVLLSIALLRVAAIPARAVAGVFDDGDGVLSAAEMRIWAEFLGDDGWEALPALSDGIRPVVFRIFSSAEDISVSSVADNFFQGFGLRMRPVD